MGIYLADTAAQNALSLSGYAPVYQAAASAYGFPANVLAAQGFVESSYNPNAYNPSGATGIAQFMPSTAAQYGVNPANPVSSIYGQAQYDANLLAQNGGNLSAALEQYSGNTPGYANRVLGIAGGTQRAQPQYLYQLMNQGNGVNTAQSPLIQAANNTQGVNAAYGVTGTNGNAPMSYLNPGCSTKSCGFSPSCWVSYFSCVIKQDALTIFLLFFAILLVGFGIYKLSGTKAPSVVPVPL